MAVPAATCGGSLWFQIGCVSQSASGLGIAAFALVPRECLGTSLFGWAAMALHEEARELEADGRATEAAVLLRKCFRLSPALADVYGC